MGVVIQIDKRCSKCVFGNQIVAMTAGGSLNDDGTETSWYLTKVIPVGQTRNCFNPIQKILFDPPKFIHPKEDDTCINPKKFKQK